jgi:hypothetical protein
MCGCQPPNVNIQSACINKNYSGSFKIVSNSFPGSTRPKLYLNGGKKLSKWWKEMYLNGGKEFKNLAMVLAKRNGVNNSISEATNG